MFNTTVYEGFDPTPYPDMDWGWNSEDAAFDKLLTPRPFYIIEVGTWLGRSAIHMAQLCPAATIYCVDTFLGSAEMWMDWHPNKEECQAALAPKFGYPTLYYQFLANVIRAGVQEQIIPVPQTTANAAQIFAYAKLQVDAVYIDAAHDRDAVYSDMLAYWELIKPGGLMFGDDYNWDGVREATEMFNHMTSRQVQVEGIKWAIRKSVS